MEQNLRWILLPSQQIKAFKDTPEKYRYIMLYNNDFFIHLKLIRGDLLNTFSLLVQAGVNCVLYQDRMYPSLTDIINTDLPARGYKQIALDLKEYCETAASQRNFEDYL